MKSFEKINPAIKATPLMILLTMALPQLLLALFRSHDLYMIRDAIQEHQSLIYLNYLGFPLLMAGLAFGLMAYCRRRGGDLPRLPMLGYFLLLSASLVTYLLSLEHLIPAGVDAWIMPIGTFMMVQLASTMPGLFFGFIYVANIRWFNHALANIGASFGLFIITPGLLFVIINAFPMWSWPEGFVITMFVGGTLACAYAFLQLMLWMSGRMRSGWIATVLFAILFPVGGLLLNRVIPFPADLQHWGFYALAIANGLVLLWGCLPSAKNHALCAWMTAFSFPFTCYFFILFLPFLPFSILAMIAIGSGFLILTPAILFILHTRQLVLQFQSLSTRFRRSALIAGFLSAFLLVPLAYVTRAYHHRNVFIDTLDRVYAAPVDTAEPMPDPETAAYALKKLKDSKTGVYVPILSENYNRIVFGGMVLPDKKIKQLEQLLLGDVTDDWNANDDFAFYSFFTDQTTRTSGRNVVRTNRDVVLSDTAVSHEQSEGTIEATVLLTMKPEHNRGQAEYLQFITIPDGVFVSGYELKIGDEMVPARMSDRRAAMWVYHMIRDRERRDPGLLIYDGPNRLRLSVYPLAVEEERQCAIRFLYPAGLSPRILIGNELINLPSDEPAVTQVSTANGRQAVCIPSERSKEMSGVVRTLKKISLSGSDETPGYCPEWDIKRALLEYWASGNAQLESVPWFVTETEQPLVEFDGAAWWLDHLPDSDWSDQQPAQQKMIPLMAGNQVRVIPGNHGGMAIFDNSEPLNIEADTLLGPDTRYAKAIDLWQDWWQTQRYPEQEEGLRRPILLEARELNILVPSTSFLAVETTAQQKALKEAEKKSLASHQALEFDEFDEQMDSPEPALLFLMLIILPLVHWIKLNRQRNA